MHRRECLKRIAGGIAAIAAPSLGKSGHAGDNVASNPPEALTTRGVVLLPSDLVDTDWPAIAGDAGLTTIGVHGTPSHVAEFIESEDGQRFKEECQRRGLALEYELHAMNDLLPRNLFAKNPDMFRMDDSGRRVADFNCCPHSQHGIDVICEQAVKFAERLRPSTNRYYYWTDDAAPMCRCPKCREFSESDLSLLVENEILRTLRKDRPGAMLSHLAYVGTLPAPRKVKPESGVFLEFAPIERSWRHPLCDAKVVGRSGQGRSKISHGETLERLDANLDVFPASSAQILEYWVDVSLHSKWTRPSQPLPWHPEVVTSDLKTYADRGLRHITSFAAWVDADYIDRFGPPTFIAEYGRELAAVGSSAP